MPMTARLRPGCRRRTSPVIQAIEDSRERRETLSTGRAPLHMAFAGVALPIGENTALIRGGNTEEGCAEWPPIFLARRGYGLHFKVPRHRQKVCGILCDRIFQKNSKQ